MAKIERGTICMVTNDCTVDDINSSFNVRGHLVYGKGVFGSPSPQVMSRDGDGFIAIKCRSVDLAPIDPDDLEDSLYYAYRTSGTNTLEIPLSDLMSKYLEYEAHFNEFLAEEN